MRRYVIRDIETKEVMKRYKPLGGEIIMEFNSPTSALSNLRSMAFGLRAYYEVFDTLKGVVIEKYTPRVKKAVKK